MNTNVITLDSGTLMYNAEKIMHTAGIRRLTLVNNGKLAGLVNTNREVLAYGISLAGMPYSKLNSEKEGNEHV